MRMNSYIILQTQCNENIQYLMSGGDKNFKLIGTQIRKQPSQHLLVAGKWMTDIFIFASLNIL